MAMVEIIHQEILPHLIYPKNLETLVGVPLDNYRIY